MSVSGDLTRQRGEQTDRQVLRSQQGHHRRSCRRLLDGEILPLVYYEFVAVLALACCAFVSMVARRTRKTITLDY